MLGPRVAAKCSSSLELVTSAERHKFVCFFPMSARSLAATGCTPGSLARVLKLHSLISLFTGAGPFWITGSNTLPWMNFFTFSTISTDTSPCCCRISNTPDNVHTECRRIPHSSNLAFPPCSLSNSTTASVTFNPSFRRTSAVSSTLDPLVTTSSMIKHVSPGLIVPSTSRLVP